MSWDDEDFGIEFLKFKIAKQHDVLDPENTFVSYVEVLYDTLVDYTNKWNKKRKRVRVNEVDIAFNTPLLADTVLSCYSLWLDMGARLYNIIRAFHNDKNRPRYLKIIKMTDPVDKFATYYKAEPYKLKTQKTIVKKKK